MPVADRHTSATNSSTVSTGSLLRQLRRYPAVNYAQHLRFLVDGQHVGWVNRDFVPQLADFTNVFTQADDRISLHAMLTDQNSRSAAMAAVLDVLRKRGLVPGWRNEVYPVGRGFDQSVLLHIERAAAPLFGILSYGVNVNGLVQRDDGLHVWVGRRSPTKQVDPNMLDLLAGGGLPVGISIRDNLLKECQEEAGVPATIASQAKAVSVTTLQVAAPEGLRIGQQFNFDLYLPADFTPCNTDGEVAEFMLMPVGELANRLRKVDDFSYDIALVMIDFLIRHGYVTPDDPDYLALLAALRRPITFDPS